MHRLSIDAQYVTMSIFVSVVVSDRTRIRVIQGIKIFAQALILGIEVLFNLKLFV